MDIVYTTEAKTTTINNLLPSSNSNTNSLTFIKHNSLTLIRPGIQESNMKTIKLLRVVVHNILNKNRHESRKRIVIIGLTTDGYRLYYGSQNHHY